MTKIKIIIGAAILVAVTLFTGCVAASPNPAAISVSPTGALVTNSQVPAVVYSTSPQLAQYAAQATAAAPVVSALLAATPAAPAAPFVPDLLSLIFGGVALISGIVAAKKNSDAAASAAAAQSHSDAAAALAATVQTLNSSTVPAIATALQLATQNASVATVATHLAAAANPVQL